jgi:hypothetical protein
MLSRILPGHELPGSFDRSYVHGRCAGPGRPLGEHVGFVMEALKPIAEEIGL